MMNMEAARAAGRSLVATVLVMLSLTGARARAEAPMRSASTPDPLRVALDHFYNLEYDSAEKEFTEWLKEHPGDLRALNYLAATVLQRELLRRELLEAQVYDKGGEVYEGDKQALSPELRDELLGILDKAQQVADQRLSNNPRNAEALYWAGVSHVTRALIDLTLLKARLDALGEAKKARKLNAEVLRIDPGFIDAYLVLGMYDYIVGSLPWYMKVVTSIIGYSGNKERGIAEVKRVSEQGHWAREDAKSYLAILYYREQRYTDALAVLRNLAESYPRNYVVQQEMARVYKAQENWKAAADVYDGIVAKHDSGTPGYGKIPLAKILFQAGEVRDRQGSPEQALQRYERAGKLGDNNIYVFRSELAAADICVRLNRRAEALRKYQRVAAAVPDTAEGKAARRALKRLGKNAG
jgi:tetratricopeptide (TPR) repeat protein